MARKLLLLFFPVVFCYVAEVFVGKPIVAEPNSSFGFEVKIAKIYDGRVEITVPDCLEVYNRKEYEVGTSYGNVSFYVYGKNFCSEGFYILELKISGKDYYSNNNFRSYEKKIQIPFISMKKPKISYEKTVEKCGYTKIKIKASKIVQKICVFDECVDGNEGEFEIKVCEEEKEINYSLFVFGIEIRRKLKLRFKTIEKPFEINVLDLTGDDGVIKVQVPKNSLVCVKEKYPLILNPICKFSKNGIIEFSVRMIRKIDKPIQYIEIVVNNKSLEIPIVFNVKPEIEVFYEGIKDKKIVLTVLNKGFGEATNIVLFDGKRYYTVGNLKPSEKRRIYLPYKEYYKMKVFYSSLQGENYNKTFRIIPEIIIEERKREFWKEILITFLISLVIVLAFWKK